VENAQKGASDLELGVKKLNSIIQNQEEPNIQLHNELQSQRQLIKDQEIIRDENATWSNEARYRNRDETPND